MKNTFALKSSFARLYPSEISVDPLALSQSRFWPSFQFESKPSSHRSQVSYKIGTRGTTSCAAREGALR